MPTCLKANYWSAQRSGRGVRLLHLRISVGLGGGSNGQLTHTAKIIRRSAQFAGENVPKWLSQTSWNTSMSFSLKILIPSSSYRTWNISLSYNTEKHFLGLFKCTIILLGTASGETSDICVVHCLSTPVFIERVCVLLGLDSSEAENNLPCT